MARTLLGVLEHATFKFFVVAARLFLVFGVCPNFDDLAKQRRKIFWGVSEVGKNDFPVYFCRLCVFFFVFLFSLLRSRATARAKEAKGEGQPGSFHIHRVCLSHLARVSSPLARRILHLYTLHSTTPFSL